MKKHIWKTRMLPCSMVLAILLALPACGQNTPPSAPVPSENTAQAPAESAEVTEPEGTVSAAMLLGGEETTVFLDVSDTEIEFLDRASAGNLLAVARYPEQLQGAAEALDHCDFTDLDNDGNSDLTASFLFDDGSTASLVWFFSDGGFVYNEEFSKLPGDAPFGG